MIQTLHHLECPSRALRWLTFILFCFLGGTVWAQSVTLHLTDGDKVSGLILSEDARQVVISNAWVKALPVPLADISKRETNSMAKALSPNLAPAKTGASALAAKTAVKPPPRSNGTFHGQVRIGLDAIFNTTDQQDYFGNFKLIYERPYPSSPKKFFRNTSQVDAEYQKTDGEASADRAQASNKSDIDIGKQFYAYALAGVGYDHIQKIDCQYQVGPGIGDHLVQQKDFLLNVESGLNYEAQYRSDAANLETFYLRLGTDSTWNIRKNLKLTASLAFYPDLENGGQYHNDFASNLSYGFWERLSLNLTALDSYNTEVAPGVDRNRFEIRSSLGLTF